MHTGSSSVVTIPLNDGLIESRKCQRSGEEKKTEKKKRSVKPFSLKAWSLSHRGVRGPGGRGGVLWWLAWWRQKYMIAIDHQIDNEPLLKFHKSLGKDTKTQALLRGRLDWQCYNYS